jgi:hypothetical protein
MIGPGAQEVGVLFAGVPEQIWQTCPYAFISMVDPLSGSCDVFEGDRQPLLQETGLATSASGQAFHEMELEG